MTTGSLSKSTEATRFSELVLNPRLVKRGRTNDNFILDVCRTIRCRKRSKRNKSKIFAEEDYTLFSRNTNAQFIRKNIFYIQFNYYCCHDFFPNFVCEQIWRSSLYKYTIMLFFLRFDRIHHISKCLMCNNTQEHSSHSFITDHVYLYPW